MAAESNLEIIPACYYSFGFAPIKGKKSKDKRANQNFCINGVLQTDDYSTLFYKAGISTNLTNRESKYKVWAKKNNLECYLTTAPIMFECVKDARGFEKSILEWGTGNELDSEDFDPEWGFIANTNYQLPEGYTPFGGSASELFWLNPLDTSENNFEAFGREYNACYWKQFWEKFGIEDSHSIRKKFHFMEEELEESTSTCHYRYYPSFHSFHCE